MPIEQSKQEQAALREAIAHKELALSQALRANTASQREIRELQQSIDRLRDDLARSA